MRKALRILALLLVVMSLAGWLAGGRHTGWTKISVTHMETDPVTDIKYPVEEKKFVLGVELLAAAFVSAGVLFVVSFLVRKKN